jgi:lysophospholipase L1-like esterase
VKAAGYSNTLAIISKVNESMTEIERVVRSVDETMQWYEYRVTAPGYFSVSANITKPVVIELKNDANVLPFFDLALFNKFGVVGDSFASGQLYFNNEYTENHAVSWGQILARKKGTTCTNYSAGGLSTRTWLTHSKGLPALLANPAEDVYYLALGINDYGKLGESYIGTINDITDHTNYNDYGDTFFGNYGRIIEQIRTHAPNAMLVMFTCANTSTVPALFNAAIIQIAEHYGIPYIVQAEDEFFESDVYTNMAGGHPTAIGYAGMACAFERLLTRCVCENIDYFKSAYMY